jgi:peroxiredoxin
MKYFAVSLLLILGVITPAQALVKTGEAAPNFTAMDAVSGHEISLHDLKGRIVLLEWTNYDCPFVRKHYNFSNMQNLQARAKKDDVIWISINSGGKGRQGYFENDADALVAMQARKATPAHYIRDVEGEIGRLYGAKTTPHIFIIDAKGMLVYQGAIDDKRSVDPGDVATAQSYINAALWQLAAGKKITHTNTRPYGCSVKYSY